MSEACIITWGLMVQSNSSTLVSATSASLYSCMCLCCQFFSVVSTLIDANLYKIFICSLLCAHGFSELLDFWRIRRILWNALRCNFILLPLNGSSWCLSSPFSSRRMRKYDCLIASDNKAYFLWLISQSVFGNWLLELWQPHSFTCGEEEMPNQIQRT